MATYSVAQTKDNLSALIERAKGGEEVVITKRGKPTARIVAASNRERRNRRAATELLRQRVAALPPIDVPVDRFYDWLYEDEEA